MFPKLLILWVQGNALVEGSAMFNTPLAPDCVLDSLNKRTNGPVNAHLRSTVYMNVIENSPSIEAGEALGPLFFSE